MKLEVLEVGRLPYREGYRLQAERLDARVSHREETDALLLVEHDPVYTLGQHADRGNLLWSDGECERRGIGLEQTDRGGQITYHGPGQLTGYPILRLTKRGGRGVAWYVDRLEACLIQTLQVFGIVGGRDPVNPGVWVAGDKIAAIGVRVRRGVTMHGFALNVAVDLSHYAGIVPCGIAGRGVTSMHRFRPGLEMADVTPVLVGAFTEVFGYDNVVRREGGLACAM